VKIMSFNLRTDNILDMHNRWAQRSNIVYDVFEPCAADVIGLQEVTCKMAKDLKDNIKEYQHLGISRTSRLFMERNTILIRKQNSIRMNKTFWLTKDSYR